MNVPPEVIYIIRHAEKPLKPPLSGVDFEGGQTEHSLLPRGWQRLAPPLPCSIRTSVRYGQACGLRLRWRRPRGGIQARRPRIGHIRPFRVSSERLGLPITSQFAQGQEQQLADSLVRGYSGVVLICWEHSHIPVIASWLPVVSGAAIPRKWPGDRYDVIWSFTLIPAPGPVRYIFAQIPQQLLSGDAGTVIRRTPMSQRTAPASTHAIRVSRDRSRNVVARSNWHRGRGALSEVATVSLPKAG